MNNVIPAVDKSVQILEMLSEAPASQVELSKALGISMSTVYRILQTLACRDWVKKDDRGTYFLASGVLTLFTGRGTRWMNSAVSVIRRANFLCAGAIFKSPNTGQNRQVL